MEFTSISELKKGARSPATGNGIPASRSFRPDFIGATADRENGCSCLSLGQLQSLTIREREVIPLVAEGLPNKGVARQLGVSEGTVKVHLHNIFQKTGVKNRTALAALALAEAASEFFADGR